MEKCKQESFEEQTTANDKPLKVFLDTCTTPIPSTMDINTTSDMSAKSIVTPHTCAAPHLPWPEIIFVKVHNEDEVAISGSSLGTYSVDMSVDLPTNQSNPNQLDKALSGSKLEMLVSDDQLECSTDQNHVQYTYTNRATIESVPAPKESVEHNPDKQPEPVLSPVSTSPDNILMVAALSVPATKESVQHIPAKPPEPVFSPVSTSPDNVLRVAALSEDP
jgi:hypothetical protein